MLKHGSASDIKQMFDRLRKSTNDLVKDVIQLVYFMRGSIQYDAMLHMTYAERKLVQEFIEERLDVESKKVNPIY